MIIGARAHDFGINSEIPFEERLDLIKSIGYETIQLAPAKVSADINMISEITWQHIKMMDEVLHKVGMDVSILGCYIQPSVKDREQRLADVSAFQQNITYAKYLNIPVVGTETSNILECGDRPQDNLIDSLKRMAETAERENIIIGVEPVAGDVMGNPEIARSIIDKVGSEKVKVIFDPVNLLTAETVDRQEDIFRQTYELLGNDIVAVHFKDFTIKDGRKFLVPLGKGVVNLSGVLQWLKVNKPDVPVLRENSKRECDSEDIAFIKQNWI